MLEKIQVFLVVLQEGSINRAALRLRMAQSAVTRQMQALEAELGGRLLERRSSGVVPTGLGHVVATKMEPVLESYHSALAEIQQEASGVKSKLRVGYLVSAAQALLIPALDRFREKRPSFKLKLLDMSPKEQIDALRAGKLDIALIGQEGAVASKDFHSKKICSVSVSAALAESDPLSKRPLIELKELKNHGFVGIDEDQMPGRNRWISALCRKAGFKPRFIGIVDGITNVLSLVASETAVTLMPSFTKDFPQPGVRLVPIKDAEAHWDFIVLWQRGKASEHALRLIDELAFAGKRLQRQG